MKILSIALKDLRHAFREKGTVFMMLVFPLLLIFVLGTALGGNMSNSRAIKDEKHAIYYIENKGALSEGFERGKDVLKNESISLMEIEDKDEGMEMLVNGEKAALIVIDSEENGIEVLKSSRYYLEGQFIEYAVEALSDYIQGVYVDGGIKSHTSIVTIDDRRVSSAMDYYGVTMLTLIIAYLISHVSSMIILDRKRGRENRLKVAGVNGLEIFAGRFLGFFVMGIIQTVIIMAVGYYGFDVYYGDNIILVGAMIISQVALMVSIGIAVGIMSSTKGNKGNLLNLIIPLMVFLGGGYFPVENLGDIFTKIAVISPIKWINQSVFNVIYSGSNEGFIKCLGINLGVAALMMLLVAVKYRFKGASVVNE